MISIKQQIVLEGSEFNIKLSKTFFFIKLKLSKLLINRILKLINNLFAVFFTSANINYLLYV